MEHFGSLPSLRYQRPLMYLGEMANLPKVVRSSSTGYDDTGSNVFLLINETVPKRPIVSMSSIINFLLDGQLLICA